jgi:hypothetical protein
MLRIEPRLAFINGVLLANRVLIFRFQLLAVYRLIHQYLSKAETFVEYLLISSRIKIMVMGQKPPNKKPPVKSTRSKASQQKSPERVKSPLTKSPQSKAPGQKPPNKNPPNKMPPGQKAPSQMPPVICLPDKKHPEQNAPICTEMHLRQLHPGPRHLPLVICPRTNNAPIPKAPSHKPPVQ